MVERPFRVLLIAPHGSYRTLPYVEAARRLNIDLVVASQGKHSLIQVYNQGLNLDLSSPADALQVIDQAHQQTPFDYILGSDDATIELAALAARRLGLLQNPPEAARYSRRKDLARERLRQSGVPVPWHGRIDLQGDLLAQGRSLRYPAVLKPLAMSGSRGVIRVDNTEAFTQACARIAAIVARQGEEDEQRYLLAERYLPGVEIALDGLLLDGGLQLLAMFDKPEPLEGPFFEESYYITPSRLTQESQRRIVDRVEQACRAYGLREGPIHAECRVDGDEVWILEVAARTIGGQCGRLLQFGTGYSLEELVLTHAQGAAVSLQRGEGGAGVLMIPIEQGGILRRIEGLSRASRIPFIEEINIQIREGHELIPLPEGNAYLGFIFARAPSPAEAEQALRAAHACLNIVVAPLWRGLSNQSLPTASDMAQCARQ